VSCFAGYYTTGGAPGVGRAVNNTVVYSVLMFFAANYFLTSAMFGAVN
jgi:phospholipid/cholesterol/gamma-HCH transport system permease protein